MGFSIQITYASDFIKDVGMDSLDFAEFVMIMEETYSITIPENDFTMPKTVGQMASYIIERKAITPNEGNYSLN
jgi:acyl carrier protein